MLSSKYWNNKAGDIKLVYLYSTIKMMLSPINIRIKDVCPSSHITLNIEINICMHSFPLPLIVSEFICHCTTQINQHYHKTQTSLWDWNLNNIWRNVFTCTVSPKFYSTGSPLTTGTVWKEQIYKMILRVKNKQKKKWPSTKLHKNRWIFFKLTV
jgi:hypothetical protein